MKMQKLVNSILTAIFILSLLVTSSAQASGDAPAYSVVDNSDAISISAQSIPPQVSLDSTIDLKNLDPRAPFIVIFNQPMETNNLVEALITYPYIANTLTWDETSTILTLTPQDSFSPGENYTFFLDPDLETADRQRFEQVQYWQAQVRSGPAVTSRSPNAESISNRTPTIKLEFDRAMDHESVEGALSVLPSIPMTFTWLVNTLSINLNRALVPGQRYSFVLSAAATDAEGIPMDEDYRWDYWLNALVISATNPTLKYNRVKLEFNYNIDTTKTGTPFTISPPVEGSWKWWNTTFAEFTITGDIDYGKMFTISLTSDLYDDLGNSIPAPSVPILFNAPPPIASVTPKPDEGDVVKVVSINFSTSMDKGTTQAAFSINPPADGYFEWDGDTLNYRLTTSLQPWQGYTVQLNTNATDIAGNPILVSPYIWTFYSEFDYEKYSTGTSFASYGPNVQEVNAKERRIVHFRVSPIETTLNFSLYPLELGEFAVRYSTEFGFFTYNKTPSIDTSGIEPVYTWQATYPTVGVQEVFIPAEVPVGIYILDMKYGTQDRGQIFIALTDYSVMTKQAGDDIFVWVSNFEGKAAAEMEVRLYSDHGEKIRVGETDDNGIYRTTIPDGYDPMLIGILADNGDAAFVGLTGYSWQTETGDISTADGSSYWEWYWGSTPSKYSVYTYTDRPIYRPGQTVYFKSLIREDRDARFLLPAEGTPVLVKIRDGRDNLLQTIGLTTNNFGSVYGEFTLIEDAPLGEYSIEIEVNKESHSQDFKVQDYRKSDIQLTVSTDAMKYVVGDKVTVDIDASYFLGEPLPSAKLTIQRYALSMSWRSNDYSWNPVGGEFMKVTDENGHFTHDFIASQADEYYRTRSWRNNLEISHWAIEVTVDDGSHQAVSSAAIFMVYNTAETISFVINGGYLHRPDEPITIHSKASTITGEPVSDKDLKITTVWHSRTNDSTQDTGSIEITTDSSGAATTSITLTRTGYYKITLSGKDSYRRDITCSRWIYIYRDKDSWANNYEHKITISANQDSYQPYDMAKFFIETSISGPALLTFERNSVIHYKEIDLVAPVTIVEAEIIPEYAPNVFVSVSTWEKQDTRLTPPKDDYYWTPSIPDSILRQSTAEILVEPSGKNVNVQITPDKEFYSPREDATFVVKVSSDQGKPVSAEISLALVDEAIFSLSNDLSGSIFDAFYSRRQYSVDTFDSMSPIRYLVYDEGGRGGGGDGEGYTYSPRQDFPDTAAWYPSLVTDKNGEVQVTLTLPDNLTSWRVIVKAHTDDTRVGEAYINVQTKQDIVIRPILPSALTVEDQVELAAMIYNYDEIERKVTANILVSGYLSNTTPSEQTINLKPGEMQIVAWSVTAEQAGQADVTITANAGADAGDAILLPINIRPLSIPDIYSQTGDFTGELVTTLVRPVGTLKQSAVEIRLSRSVAGTLFEGLAYLTGYPYGCIEQTMSRALPNAVVGRVLNRFGIVDPILEGKLPGLINMGLQRLYGMQHYDGGWGWWYDDSSDSYQTAWVIFGLALTADAGYIVEPTVLEAGVNWLKNHLDEMDIRTRAYATYSLALAGYGDLTSAESLAINAYQLDTFSQAALALTLQKLGNNVEARQILKILEESAGHKETNGGEIVYWPQPNEDGQYYQKTMSSTVRSSALALDAFVQIDPQNSLIPGIAKFLMQERKTEGWGSTNETTFAILSLTNHLLSTQTENPDLAYSIELNGEEISSGTFPSGQPTFTYILPVENMQVGANLLRIKQDGSNEMYYTLVSKMFLAQTEISAAGGIKINRSYQSTLEGSGIIRAGDLVRVSLKITIDKGAYFLIIEDLLPGGLEALNEKLNSSSHNTLGGYEYYEGDIYWQSFGYNQKEVHPDRVTFFITEFKPGTHVITYFARATHAGTFIAMPTEVYAMYDATVWGRSASSPLTIEK